MLKNLLLIAVSFLTLNSLIAGGFTTMSVTPSGPFGAGTGPHTIKFYVKEVAGSPPAEHFVKLGGAAPTDGRYMSSGTIAPVANPAGSVTIVSSAADPSNPYLWEIQFSVPSGSNPIAFSIGIGVNIVTTNYVAGVAGVTGSVITATAFSSSILPIELSRFDAQVTGQNVILSWATETETNNKSFVVERSFNGRDFEAVGTIAGAGTSITTKSYTMEDNSATATTSAVAYYRLKNFDFDGQESVSKVLSVKLRNGNSININGIYPAESILALSANENTEANISIMTIDGQILSSQAMELNKGYNKANIDLSNLNRGLYFVVIRTGNEVVTKKFVF